ncbi:hypothetical protein LPJ78_004336 [Coemansia sp. RSA 989]|nr:hypothetical protein LPJ68_001369 [Coemansia sp. RSA 1086]KAJ1747190.1 hypothetical protein LPJ79_005422 [Coemansia sp. RSA 1821]KAJ1863012.1 hypothetical protein LPJ78_004336 [Coemansia sp. RSA 989]KAJ2628422.1 hypothetical protein H4R22_003898 [Coemansia sp. RSA 1290]KAJ2653392.1 hypothetical protein IWW40_000445 [Coemansia sp. RSA 1250]
MVTTPMPAAFRKRSALYAKNINHRGHVKKSLNPKVEERLEAERLRKQGLKNGLPTLGPNGRKVVLVLLAITLGSMIYQMLMPLFALSWSSSTNSAAKTEAQLTKEQQAKAAEAILRAMNKRATEKYLKTAKDYKPPEPVMVQKKEDDDDDEFIEMVSIPEDTVEPLV